MRSYLFILLLLPVMSLAQQGPKSGIFMDKDNLQVGPPGYMKKIRQSQAPYMHIPATPKELTPQEALKGCGELCCFVPVYAAIKIILLFGCIP